MLHCRQEKGRLEEGVCREVFTDTAVDKGHTGGGRGAGGGVEESLLCFQEPVICFPSWFTRHEGFCHHGNRSVGHEGVSVLHSWRLLACPLNV